MITKKVVIKNQINIYTHLNEITKINGWRIVNVIDLGNGFKGKCRKCGHRLRYECHVEHDGGFKMVICTGCLRRMFKLDLNMAKNLLINYFNKGDKDAGHKERGST